MKKANLCLKCLTEKRHVRDCKSQLKCGIDGCERNYNRIFYNNLAHETAWSVKGLLQVGPFQICAKHGSFVETKAVCETASSQTWIDKEFIQYLRLEGRNTSISVTGIHGSNSTDCWKVPVKIGPADEISDTVEIKASSYKDLVVGTSVYNVIELSERYFHLSCID